MSEREQAIKKVQDVLASVEFAMADHPRGCAGLIVDALGISQPEVVSDEAVLRSPRSGQMWGVAIDATGGEERVSVTELEAALGAPSQGEAERLQVIENAAKEILLLGNAGGCREEVRGNKCWAPAEFILWGRLIPPEGLGPRCYDHAAKHVGHRALGDPSWAIVDLRSLRSALVNKTGGRQWDSQVTGRE